MAKALHYPTQGKYILQDGKVVPVDNLYTWMAWFETANRRMYATELGFCWVSTVFVSISYDFCFETLSAQEPRVFETMIFYGKTREDIGRYQFARIEDCWKYHRRAIRDSFWLFLRSYLEKAWENLKESLKDVSSGVAGSTSDSESGNGGSNPPSTTISKMVN